MRLLRKPLFLLCLLSLGAPAVSGAQAVARQDTSATAQGKRSGTWSARNTSGTTFTGTWTAILDAKNGTVTGTWTLIDAQGRTVHRWWMVCGEIADAMERRVASHRYRKRRRVFRDVDRRRRSQSGCIARRSLREGRARRREWYLASGNQVRGVGHPNVLRSQAIAHASHFLVRD
jgi:hypothetical protein